MSCGKCGVPKTYELPKLPYAYDALAPAIEEKIVQIHHDKHHAAYVNGLNAALQKLEDARSKGDFTLVKALSRDVAFNGSGHVLHTLYWNSMTPGGSGDPAGKLLSAIEHSFSSYASFKAQFIAAAKDVEASGWAVLAREPMADRLLILQCEKHQNLTVWGVQPLMVCDVWEHAYYLQYQNRRADYIEAFCKLIDWRATAGRYEQAVAES